MSIDQICAVNVRSLAHTDSLLWLWVTNHHIFEAGKVIDSWGFKHRTILTWAKDRIGTGDWLRGQTEHCLFAVRGKPTVQLTNQTTLLHGPRRKNSQKPVEFYDFVERLCPAPRYAYLFSRYRHNENWDCHGDEAPAPESGANSPPEPPTLPPSKRQPEGVRPLGYTDETWAAAVADADRLRFGPCG